MVLDPSNFEFPNRHYGMDHDRYKWSLMYQRPKIKWPSGRNIALWITVAVEVFPLNDDRQPFPLPGSMAKPYPDLQNYTWRDYGNRVGIYRLMRAFDRFGISPTWAINSAVADQLPGLMKDISARNEEIIAHGVDMASPHSAHLSKEDERALIRKSIDRLNEVAPKPIQGWMSPGKAQSPLTPELLAEAGMEFFCDWPNDELPYEFRTDNGPLIAMPHSSELDDRQIIIDYKHDEGSFVDQIKDHYHYLSREAEHGGGRIISINLHPWVIGQSHRIAAIEEILEFLIGQKDIWSATNSDIISGWRASLDKG